MAAKALIAANKVWQTVRAALAGANEASKRQFDDLKLYLATQKGNPDLQFVPFSNVTGDQATLVASGGCTLYGLYLKKQNTATDAWFKLADHGTVAGGASGAAMTITLPLLVGNDEIACIFPTGLILATGITVASETTAAGGADTVTGDGPNGFAIVG
jgi:hypothetical protein